MPGGVWPLSAASTEATIVAAEAKRGQASGPRHRCTRARTRQKRLGDEPSAIQQAVDPVGRLGLGDEARLCELALNLLARALARALDAQAVHGRAEREHDEAPRPAEAEERECARGQHGKHDDGAVVVWRAVEFRVDVLCEERVEGRPARREGRRVAVRVAQTRQPLLHDLLPPDRRGVAERRARRTRDGRRRRPLPALALPLGARRRIEFADRHGRRGTVPRPRTSHVHDDPAPAVGHCFGGGCSGLGEGAHHARSVAHAAGRRGERGCLARCARRAAEVGDAGHERGAWAGHCRRCLLRRARVGVECLCAGCAISCGPAMTAPGDPDAHARPHPPGGPLAEPAPAQ